MPDPLYAGIPPCPCRETYTTVDDCYDTFTGYSCFSSNWLWSDDNGYCLGIQQPQYDIDCGITVFGQDYYAHADQYEALYVSASGSPALPVGSTFTSSYFVPSVGQLYV